MYVHKILFNELYVMPLCPFHSLPKTPEKSNSQAAIVL